MYIIMSLNSDAYVTHGTLTHEEFNINIPSLLPAYILPLMLNTLFESSDIYV